MGRTTLRRFAVLAAIAFGACRTGGSEPTVVKTNDLELRANVSPIDLRVGDNEMMLELRDAQGRAVNDADVAVTVHMQAMGAMPAMGGPATVRTMGDGRFRAEFQLDMSGTWQVEIRARRHSGETLAAEGSVTVGTPGVRLVASQPEGSASTPRASETLAAGELPTSEHPGEFRMDPSRLRQVGVHSEPARRDPLISEVRAMGRVAWDERALRDVTLRIAGFAGKIEANATGQRVERGQVLFWLYSPQLYTAQQEYLQALRSRQAARGTAAPDRADALVHAAERRLALWDLDASDIQRIAQRGAPEEYLPVRAPASGYVVEKQVVEGAAVAMGQRVYRIAPLDRVWIEAEIYESEIERVAVGDPAEVTLPYHPGMRLAARVAYVYPALEGDRRTARVRLELANPEDTLRPDMYANIFLRRDMGTRLTVPDTAVLHTGDKSFVFVDLGDGRLRPQRVEVGMQSAGRVEILSGLDEGQPVVVAGTFLVAGESRLRAALEAW
jgi:membrane fusion protein, copper/silver efflux system